MPRGKGRHDLDDQALPCDCGVSFFFVDFGVGQCRVSKVGHGFLIDREIAAKS